MSTETWGFLPLLWTQRPRPCSPAHWACVLTAVVHIAALGARMQGGKGVCFLQERAQRHHQQPASHCREAGKGNTVLVTAWVIAVTGGSILELQTDWFHQTLTQLIRNRT